MANQAPLPLLQQHDFRRLMFAKFSSRVAQYSLNLALVLLVVEETERAFFSSLLVLALVVPTTFAGLLSGALSDRFPKRLMMVVGHLGRAAMCFAFAGSDPGAAGYFVVAVLMSLMTPVATAAEGAAIPAIVERRLLTRANAANQATNGIAQFIGFGLVTPVLLRIFDSPSTLFMVCGALFVVAAVNASMMGPARSHQQIEVGGEPDGPWFAGGWRALRKEPRTWRATLELTLISVSVIVLGGLIPKYIQEVLGLRIDVGVIVLIPGAIGVALGLRLAGFLAHRIPHALLSSVGFFVYVGALGVLAAVEPFAEFLSGYGWFSWLDGIDLWGFDKTATVACLAVLPLGFSFALVSVAAQTLLNDLIPLRLQGRAGATQSAFAALASAGPVLVAGAVADVVGVAPVIGVVAVSTAVLATGRIGSQVAGRP